MWRWSSASRRGLETDDALHPARDRVLHPDGVPQLREVLPLITAEFERARRYERTVTIAVFSAGVDRSSDPPSVPGNGRAAGASGDDGRSLPALLASVVRHATREMDLVACDLPGRRCIVVLPEIGHEEGRRAVNRMRQLCAANLSRPIRADIAVFPRDGWLFPDLVDLAQRNAQSVEKEQFVVPASDAAM